MGITELVRDNFHRITGDPTKDVLVHFYDGEYEGEHVKIMKEFKDYIKLFGASYNLVFA